MCVCLCVRTGPKKLVCMCVCMWTRVMYFRCLHLGAVMYMQFNTQTCSPMCMRVHVCIYEIVLSAYWRIFIIENMYIITIVKPKFMCHANSCLYVHVHIFVRANLYETIAYMHVYANTCMVMPMKNHNHIIYIDETQMYMYICKYWWAAEPSLGWCLDDWFLQGMYVCMYVCMYKSKSEIVHDQ